MESGAKGCEVIVSGKLRAQRAKSMKFKDGYMVSSGDPTRVYLDTAVRHVALRQGMLGIKVGVVPYSCVATAFLRTEFCSAGEQYVCCWPVFEGFSVSSSIACMCPASIGYFSCCLFLASLWSVLPRPCLPQVKIMKDWDPTGRQGPKMPLPDVVKVHEPKEEEIYTDKPYIGKEGAEL